jgi:hypothetical protein
LLHTSENYAAPWQQKVAADLSSLLHRFYSSGETLKDKILAQYGLKTFYVIEFDPA